MDIQELLTNLHGSVAKEYLRRIADGEATAADLAGAVKFLKDNGIDCYGKANEDVASLAEEMSFPFDVDEDDDVVTQFKGR